jgi:hypothetical protein
MRLGCANWSLIFCVLLMYEDFPAAETSSMSPLPVFLPPRRHTGHRFTSHSRRSEARRNEGPCCSTYLLSAIDQSNSLEHWPYLTHPTCVSSSCAHVGADRNRRNYSASSLHTKSAASEPEHSEFAPLCHVEISTLLDLGPAIATRPRGHLPLEDLK